MAAYFSICQGESHNSFINKQGRAMPSLEEYLMCLSMLLRPKIVENDFLSRKGGGNINGPLIFAPPERSVQGAKLQKKGAIHEHIALFQQFSGKGIL